MSCGEEIPGRHLAIDEHVRGREVGTKEDNEDQVIHVVGDALALMVSRLQSDGFTFFRDRSERKTQGTNFIRQQG